MKKILNIFAFLAIATAFMACSDSENDVVDNSLKVLSSNLAFEPNGGEGFVVVDQAIVDATTTADWVTTKVEGNKVTLTVSPNSSSRESRNAKLVIKSAQSSVVVAVSQNGFVFNTKSASDISTNNDASNQFIPVSYYGTLSIVECPTWITATVQEDGIAITIDKNNTGKLRTGSVVFKAGDFQQSVSVTQFDVKENLFGSYYLSFYTEEGETAVLAEISDSAIVLPEYNITIPAKFDYNKNSLTLTGLSACGTYSSYYLFTLIVSGENLTLDKLPCTFNFAYDAEYGNFVAEGSTSFVIGAFTSEKPSGSTFAGSLMEIIAPCLLKK